MKEKVTMVEDIRPAVRLIAIAEAAAMCGVNSRTLSKWSRCGLAPKPLRLKHGTRGSLRYRLQDMVDWIAGGCEPVDKDAGVEAAPVNKDKESVGTEDVEKELDEVSDSELNTPQSRREPSPIPPRSMKKKANNRIVRQVPEAGNGGCGSGGKCFGSRSRR